MKLEHMIVALWIISSMLACWAFSLAVRWFADRRARKVKDLQGKYSLKSKLLAAGLILVCMIGSSVAAGSAVMISNMPAVNEARLSALGAVGFGMAMFSVFLATWAFIGDRSRGRQRCPKCWYDMQGSEGLPCPECGCKIKSPQHLLKTRRPKWAFFVAIVLVLSGLICVGLNAQFRDHGLLGFIPSSVLISLRDHVPEDWIYDNGFNDSTLRLTDRILDGSISVETRRALAIEIAQEMLNNQTLRYEPRRMELLSMVQYVELTGARGERERALSLMRGEEVPWIPPGTLIQDLYAQSLADYAQLSTNDASMDADLAVAVTNAVYEYRQHTWYATRTWLLSQESTHPTSPNEYYRQLDDAQVDALSQFTATLADQIRTHDSVSVYLSEDTTRTTMLLSLESELGLLRERLPLILERIESGKSPPPRLFNYLFSTSLKTVPQSQRTQYHELLTSWIKSGDERKQVDAINAISSVYGNNYARKITHTPPEVRALVELMVEHTLDIHRRATFDTHEWTIGDQTWSAIISVDSTGEYAFPMIRDELLNPSGSSFRDSFSNLQMYNASTERLEHWLDTFEPLSNHEDPRIRLAIVHSIPMNENAKTDARVNALIKHFMDDEDERIVDEATRRSIVRENQ